MTDLLHEAKKQHPTNDDDDDNEKKDCEVEKNEVFETIEEQQHETRHRNFGMKYKKWSSEKERNKYYKSINNGTTISTRKKVGEEKVYPPIPSNQSICPRSFAKRFNYYWIFDNTTFCRNSFL